MLAFMHKKQSSAPFRGTLGGILNAGMGVGKTFTAIAHVLNHYKPGDAPFLVVTELSIMSEWATQVDMFVRPEIARKILFFHPSFKERMEQPASFAGYIMVVTNYQAITLSFKPLEAALTSACYEVEKTMSAIGKATYWNVAKEPANATIGIRPNQGIFHRVAWGGAFFDESQKANNISSVIYKALMTLCVKGPRWALTGTPFRNYSLDYYAQCMLVGFDYYKERKHWRKEEDVRDIFEDEDLEENLIFTLSAEDVKDVQRGQLTRVREAVELSEAERASYNAEEKILYSLVVESRHGHFEFATVLTKLGDLRRRVIAPILQHADDARALDERVLGSDGIGSSKMRALVACVQDLAVTGMHHKLLVFSSYQACLLLAELALERALPEVTVMRIDGTVKAKERMELQTAFNAFSDGPCVLLLSAKIGSTGLNIQGASGGILLDEHWTTADEEQQIARFWRAGQLADEVIWCKLVVANTIEEWVEKLAHGKKQKDNHIRGRTQQSSLRVADSLYNYLAAKYGKRSIPITIPLLSWTPHEKTQ